MKLPIGIAGLFGSGPFPSKRAEDFMTIFNPDPSQRPQRSAHEGVLSGGLSDRLTGLLGDPLFNMGVAMMGSRSPSFGGSLAEGLRGAQGAQIMAQQRQDSLLDNEYRRAQIESLRNRPYHPLTRKFSLPNGQVQDQEYDPQTRQWVPIGSAYHRTAENGAPSTVQEVAWLNDPSRTSKEIADFWAAKRAQTSYLKDVNQVPTYVERPNNPNLPITTTPLSTQSDENQAASDRKAAEAFGAATGKYEGERGQPTPAQTAVDTTFAKDYADFVAGGGYADIQKQLAQLSAAGESLDKNNVSGPIIGATPDFILSAVNPNAVSTRETIQEVAQRNLRLILGAQFTEKEGERLIRRVFNPSLPEEVNRERLKLLLQQISAAAEAKASAARYYETNGTLRGWNGRLPKLSDFMPNDEQSPKESLPNGWSVKVK